MSLNHTVLHGPMIAVVPIVRFPALEVPLPVARSGQAAPHPPHVHRRASPRIVIAGITMTASRATPPSPAVRGPIRCQVVGRMRSQPLALLSVTRRTRHSLNSLKEGVWKSEKGREKYSAQLERSIRPVGIGARAGSQVSGNIRRTLVFSLMGGEIFWRPNETTTAT